MPDFPDYTDEYIIVGRAWNLIMGVKSSVPLEAFQALTRAMVEMDTALLALHPMGTIAPVVPFDEACGDCGGRKHAR